MNHQATDELCLRKQRLRVMLIHLSGPSFQERNRTPRHSLRALTFALTRTTKRPKRRLQSVAVDRTVRRHLEYVCVLHFVERAQTPFCRFLAWACNALSFSIYTLDFSP